MRQIDITLRHHERQDYDSVYKEVNSRIKQLKVLNKSLVVWNYSLFNCDNCLV